MKLIINADDFGLSKSITDGIVEGIKEGYITSTSIMANMEYAEYAIKEALKNNIDCIGLHINLTVGKPIINNKNLVDGNGTFLYNKKQILNPNLTYNDAYNEIKAQLDLVNKYSNGKIKIDHLDTHHHLCSNENIKQAIIDIAKELNIPIRNEFECEIKRPDTLNKDFTINGVTIDKIEEIVNKYKETSLSIELMTHPGYIDDYTKQVTSYLKRKEELDILKLSKEKGLFNGIALINFQQIKNN